MAMRFPIILGAFLAGTGPGLAGDSPVVIELYTSQGCSSCPPADELLRTLAGRSDVLPLAFHVDYWDYIGWKDTFGNTANADRQRSYAAFKGERTIYTPQMIIDGDEAVVGADPAALTDAIATAAARQDPLRLRLERDAQGVVLTATALGDLPDGLSVQLLRVKPSARVAVRRGENAGRRIAYTAIVTDHDLVATWDGRSDLTLPLDAPGDDDVVVLIQEPGPGRILAAARMEGAQP